MSTQRLCSLLCVLSVCVLALSVNAQVEVSESQPQSNSLTSITGSVQLPKGQSRTGDFPVKIVLNGGQYQTFAKNDGSFSIHNVPSGTYLLEVFHSLYHFEPVRVDISKANKIIATLSTLMDERGARLQYPLLLLPSRPYEFFEKREEMSIVGLVKNPMVLMVGFSLLMMFALPKMQQNMDPEQLKEMQQMTGGDMDPASMLKNLLSGGAAAAPAVEQADPPARPARSGRRRD
eukprot:GILJ01003712.1.p1 GENE.GILJ01003712.1~~GILJ01003712.1.p1  ORF type:complete len:233 (-),score=41.20 GILJ01003712.1:165-863(-)